MVRRNFMLSDSLDQSLDEAAALLGEKKSGIVSKALAQYFDRLDLEVARERAAEYEAKPDSALSADELRRRLDL
jgi:predicted transcriptional regulator